MGRRRRRSRLAVEDTRPVAEDTRRLAAVDSLPVGLEEDDRIALAVADLHTAVEEELRTAAAAGRIDREVDHRSRLEVAFHRLRPCSASRPSYRSSDQ